MNTPLSRRAFLALAALVSALMFVLSTPSAQAGCCTITIDNRTTCTGTICINTAAGTTCVTLAVGPNSYTIPGCVDVSIYVIDRCGNTVYFPTTGCTDIRYPGICCSRVCRTSTCSYTMDPISCWPC